MVEILNWLPFLYIVEFTADRKDNDKNLLPSLLNFSIFKIKCWCNPREDDLKKTAEKVAIRCSSCGKEIIIDVNFLDITYQ